MASYDIIGRGDSFYDDYGKSSIDTVGVRISGNGVERQSANGSWSQTKTFGEPVEMLYWTKDEKIYAYCRSGRMEYVCKLMANPQRNYPVKRIQIETLKEREAQRRAEEKRTQRVEREVRESWPVKKSGTPWWLKLLFSPFKLLWWIIKTIWQAF